MAWTEEMRHTVTLGRLLALSAILIVGFIVEYSGAEKSNFAFYTEKEKIQSEAKMGIFWLGDYGSCRIGQLFWLTTA